MNQDKNQNYEDYWKITNAFTDYNGTKFLDTLAICVDFIDEFKNEDYSEEKYQRLQITIQKIHNINLISIRKSINQLVKMGFINSFLRSYNPQSVNYIKAKSNKKREILLSRIIYENSSFNRAVNMDSSVKQINFLIQTLTENGTLSKEEIIALMLVDIEKHHENFLNKTELANYVEKALKSGFIDRKYNQISYLYNLLNKLNDLIFVNDNLYFKINAEKIFSYSLNKSTAKRDPYLHRLYKNQLQQESEESYGYSMCFLEKLCYPVLIASHIKPFIDSNAVEAYDPNNGLLLSRTVDSLFDLKYISFTDDGNIIFSQRLSNDVKKFWKNYKLDMTILNDERKKYLSYHRKLLKSTDLKKQ